MENQSKKATTSFKIIAFVALIWNLMGVFAYLAQVYSHQMKPKLYVLKQNKTF